MPELRIAVANFGAGGLEAGSTGRWDMAMRWDTMISVLRGWQPHIVLGQQISAAPGGLRAHLWLTANTLGMVPLLGPSGPGSAMGDHPAVLVAVGAGLVILDSGPAWQPGAGTQPAWCEALVQVPGWARPLRAYSVDLPGGLERGTALPGRPAGHPHRRTRRTGGRRRQLEFLRPHRRGRARRAGPHAAAPAAVPDAVFPQDHAPTANYDVHDVLACADMADGHGRSTADLKAPCESFRGSKLVPRMTAIGHTVMPR